MQRLTAAAVHERALADLGVAEWAADLSDAEALAAAIRRAAALHCPCAAATIARAVARPLEALVADVDGLRESVDTTLELMVAHGDLLEQHEVTSDDGDTNRVIVYLAPPSFVMHPSGTALLLGAAADGRCPLPASLSARVEHVGHVRRLPPVPGSDLQSELIDLDLTELALDEWTKPPEAESPSEHRARLDALLDAAPSAHDIPGLQVLDATRPVRYYRGRWVEPVKKTGRFVGKRTQGYGAPLWCYALLDAGLPKRFIDLPLRRTRQRGCDDAWRLQLAVDALRGEPQRYRLTHDRLRRTTTFELFSPVPRWATRRWDAFGTPAPTKGCLIAYTFEERRSADEVAFAERRLWLKAL